MSSPVPHAALPYIQFSTHIYTPNAAADTLLDAALQDSRLASTLDHAIDCCTRSACHGTLFPFLVLTPYFCPCAHGRCRSMQARLCCKSCRHVFGLGPYLLSVTSLPFALEAVTGFSSFHFRFAPMISAPFAIRRR